MADKLARRARLVGGCHRNYVINSQYTDLMAGSAYDSLGSPYDSLGSPLKVVLEESSTEHVRGRARRLHGDHVASNNLHYC